MEWPKHTSPIQQDIEIEVLILSDSDVASQAVFLLKIGKHIISTSAVDNRVRGQLPVEELQKARG